MDSSPYSLFNVWVLDSSIIGAGAGDSSTAGAGDSSTAGAGNSSIIYIGTGTANLHLCDLILLNSLLHVGQIVILIYLFIVG